MNVKICILILMTTFFFISCDDKLLEQKKVDCYFQYEYVNYAWGFSHTGFTVTPDGEVFSFDNSTPWIFGDNSQLTLEELKKNISASVKADTLISRSDIEHYVQLAFFARSGKLSDPVSRGADMGERICKIIVHDTTDPQNGYREVLLTKNGDWDQSNLSPEAAIIAEWVSKLRFH